jgi:hypothetical protein
MLMRVLAMLLILWNTTFVVWEIADYRGSNYLVNAIVHLCLVLICAAFVFLSTKKEPS